MVIHWQPTGNDCIDPMSGRPMDSITLEEARQPDVVGQTIVNGLQCQMQSFLLGQRKGKMKKKRDAVLKIDEGVQHQRSWPLARGLATAAKHRNEVDPAHPHEEQHFLSPLSSADMGCAAFASMSSIQGCF